MGVEGPLVERLIAEGFVKRNDDGSLRTVMLGGLRLMNLSRRIGAARVDGDADAVRVTKATPPATASTDGALSLGELDEWSALKAVQAGEEISEAWAGYLGGLLLVERSGGALKITALGRERFAWLTRYANATHDKRQAMLAEKGRA